MSELNSEFASWQSEIDEGLTEDILPRVPVEDVLGLQSLAMGEVRQYAYTKVRKTSPHVTGFVLGHLADKDAPIQVENEFGEYDSPVDVETYFGVVVRKIHPRSWKMLLSFLQSNLTEEGYAQNVRDLYAFYWELDDSEALGTRRVIRNERTFLETDKIPFKGRLFREGIVIAPPGSRKIERTVVTRKDIPELREKITQQYQNVMNARLGNLDHEE